MQNLNKHFKTLDELVQECIKMSPLVDIKDNVVYLKHVIQLFFLHFNWIYYIIFNLFSRWIAHEWPLRIFALDFKNSNS